MVGNFYSEKAGRLVMFFAHILLAYYFISVAGWYAGAFLRDLKMADCQQVYPFLNSFFQPQVRSVYSYIFLIFGVGCYSLFLYAHNISRVLEVNISRTAEDLAFGMLFAILGIAAIKITSGDFCHACIAAVFFLIVNLSAGLIAPLRHRAAAPGKVMRWLVSCVWRLCLAAAENRPGRAKFVLFVLAVLVALAVGPAWKVATGPFLANEYPYPSSKTLLDGKTVTAGEFYKNGAANSAGAIAEFRRTNRFEYHHIAIARGQINHIGQILNPLNEMACGKKLSEVYMQYGIGNTLMLGWLMDRFGGLDIGNYYRCYFLYIFYDLLLLGVLFYIFRRDIASVTGVFAMAVYSLYSIYAGFLLGPGAMPTIHMFDLAALAAVTALARTGNRAYGVLALAAGIAGVVWNFWFGFILLASVGLAVAVHAMDNSSVRAGAGWLAGVLALFAAVYAGYKFFFTQYDPFAKFFFNGLLCIKISQPVVSMVIVYLVVSYLFLLALRRQRLWLKYVYGFVFFYSQGMLLYYFNNGRPDHLLHSWLLFALQFFLMAAIAERLLGRYVRFARLAKNTGAAAAVLCASVSACAGFQNASIRVHWLDNITGHEIYGWNFDRAKIRTTINPAPFDEAIRLIRQYAPEKHAGICLLSKYDNILLFLAGRKTALAYYDMPNYLISEEYFNKTLSGIRTLRPEILFADSDISNPPVFLLGRLYSAVEFNSTEYAVRYGKYGKLRDLFDSVKADYMPVFRGELITVYRRKT
ncbi:MAG: hypothetical protein PHW69_04950 [Elusimicrobiaceae bacterium]|nr:hypothetical protein [Elusimicrobiaceae bacterium]